MNHLVYFLFQKQIFKSHRIIIYNNSNKIPLSEWSQIWVPDYVISNTEDNVHTIYLQQEPQSKIKTRLIQPNASFVNELEHYVMNYVYNGKDVLIVKQNEYTQRLLCNFNWQNYPFDTQVSYITVLGEGENCLFLNQKQEPS